MPPQTITLMTPDNFPIGATLYEPQTSNSRSVLISTAMGVKQSYYADFALYLAEQGFTVLVYDYRGIGRSKPSSLRGFHATLLNWAVDDQTTALTHLKQHTPNHKLFVVGHSLGSQIAGLTPNHAQISGWLGVAAQSGYWRGWDGILQLRMLLLWHVIIPVLSRIYGYFPSRLVGMGSNDIPARVVLDWASAGRMPRYIRDLYNGSAHDHFDAVKMPMRLYSFADDDFAPRRTVEALRSLYPNAQSEHKHIAPKDIGVETIGHFGFFRKPFQDTLWAEAAAWLNAQ